MGALSPNAAVNPGQITLLFQGTVADGRTNQVLKFTNDQSITVKVTPTGLTKMDGVRRQADRYQQSRSYGGGYRQ